MKLDISYLLKELTLEEKASLCSGASNWWTKAVERFGIPEIMVTDGPHGLRKQVAQADHLGIHRSVEAVCFPAGSALANSFDTELIRKLGELLGEEAKAEEIHTLLGPAINIKRSPLNGRNFEYLSEDPYLVGELSQNYVQGVQSQGVGVSAKHFAANNQEYFRMSTNVHVSERALREIYLAGFEKTVKEAQPWTLMCAYNRLNGTYCAEHSWLLDQVLRNEWGFKGIVMTDWGAINDRVKGLRAGLDLEMPSSNGFHDRRIVHAVESGELSLEDLDRTVERLLTWITKGLGSNAIDSYDKEAHHTFARKAASECAVLLKNEDQLLPLTEDTKVVFIGTFAEAPRFQGGGSSHILPFKVVSAVEAAPEIAYEPGWQPDGETKDEDLLAKAVHKAARADVAVIFAGLPDSWESEGYDRKHLDLPDCQNELIRRVSQEQPNTVVVLHSGSPVLMPWLGNVKTVLNLYLAGQAAGEATVDLLFGNAAPAGRLAETFPLRLEDTPAFLSFPGNSKDVHYAEDVFVGYRWYDARKMDVLFPFGHGLSYTEFAYKNLRVNDRTVSVDIHNVGTRPGKETVQLYVAAPYGRVLRPVRELKGFRKIALAPGESSTVTFTLDDRSFAYYEDRIQDWYIPSGEYRIEVGRSSRDIRLVAEISIESEPLPLHYADHTTVSEMVEAGQKSLIDNYIKATSSAFGLDRYEETNTDHINKDMAYSIVSQMPIHCFPSYIEIEDDFEEKILEGLRTPSDKSSS